MFWLYREARGSLSRFNGAGRLMKKPASGRNGIRHRLKTPQEQLSVALVFCVGCCVLCSAGSIDRRRSYPVIAVFETFNHIPFKKESFTMSTVTANKLKIKKPE